MEYLPQVKVTKEDFLALSDLAGEMSIMDYMSKVIHEHVAAQQTVALEKCDLCGATATVTKVYHYCSEHRAL